MAFTSFVVFAEMRTGSNFLEANLNALPGVHCYGEAFNPDFMGGEGKVELLGVTLEQRDADPAGFMRRIRAQTDGLAGFRFFNDHDPRVFDLLMDDPDCAKVILTRNQLESYISWKIALESDQWWLANTKHLKTVRPTFDAAEFMARYDRLHDFQRKLVHRLQVTGQTAFYIDYEDVLDLDVLNGLAAFLGVKARLEKLDFRFKKQNPEALRDKVANPDEMETGLKALDWFDLDHAPNFEPRRQAAVPSYVVSQEAPLMFLPIKGAPDKRVQQWFAGFGAMQSDMNRNQLRKWRMAHVGQRSFTVLRHPLARAHAVFCDFNRREWMPELRPYLKRVHKYDLPGKGKAYATADDYRAGLLVFLDLAKHMLSGRTELKLPAMMATQGAILQGFAQMQTPDVVLREDGLAKALAVLAADVGVQMATLPDEPALPFALKDIYGPDLEAAARGAYWRDYEAFGYGDWPDHAA
jgi:hypothetical protein